MSLKQCITNAQAGGEITTVEAKALKKRYDSLMKKRITSQEALDQIKAELEAEAAHRARAAKITEQKRDELEKVVLGHVNAGGRSDPAEALMWILEQDDHMRVESVAARRAGIEGMMHAKMKEAMHEFRGRAKVTGDLARRFGSTKKLLADVTRERFGQSTGNEYAKLISDSMGEALEDLRVMYNDAGGSIGKRDDFGMPTSWEREAVIDVSRVEFTKDFMADGILDREKMRHPVTGEQMTDDELKDALHFIHENISSGGMLEHEPSGQPMGNGELFKRRMDHRFLHFKNGDAWMKMQKKYGNPDPWGIMMQHVSSMSRDVAMMQKLGPNPKAMLEYIHQVVMKRASITKGNNKIRAEQLATIRKLTEALPKGIEEFRGKFVTLATEMDTIRRDIRRHQNSDLSSSKDKVADLKNRLAQKTEEFRVAKKAMEDTPDYKAWAEGLDPQLERQLATLLDEVRKELPDEFRDPVRRAASMIATSNKMFDSMRGLHGLPEPGVLSEGFAYTMQGMRNSQVFTKLGRAGVSAITDVGLQRAARRMAGMPTNRVFTAYIKQFGPGMQQVATAQGLILDSARHVLDQQTRHSVGTNFDGWTGYAADRVLVLGGLTPMTQAAKHATGLEMQLYMGQMLEKSWSQIPAPLRRALRYSGMSADDWTTFQTVGKDANGFLNPADVYKLDKEVALRYSGHIHKIMRAAVAEPTVRQRASVIGDAKAGTIYGEAMRSAMQFKGFGASVLFLHASSMARDFRRGDYGGMMNTAFNVFIVMTLMGGVSIQLKELTDGRDPRNMNPFDKQGLKFWLAAILQGGGMGIYGDFLFADQNRFGGSFAATLPGPLAGTVEDALKLTAGNAQQLAQGKDTNFTKEAIRFGWRNMTPGSNLVWSKLAAERMLLERLEEWADPKGSSAAQRRRIKNRKKQFGQEYWWEPGDRAPARSPNLGAAFGQE